MVGTLDERAVLLVPPELGVLNRLSALTIEALVEELRPEPAPGVDAAPELPAAGDADACEDAELEVLLVEELLLEDPPPPPGP